MFRKSTPTLRLASTLLLLFLLLLPSIAMGWNDTLQSIKLPRTQVQLICDIDIRSTFNITDVFNAFYKEYLPGISDTKLRTYIEISGMSDIPDHKWYYPYCDLDSTQVLATMEIDGFAQFTTTNNNNNETYYTAKVVHQILTDAERPVALQEYFEAHACENITSWRSHVQERWNPNRPIQEGNEINLDHSTYFLCGGSDQLYYDEEDPDGGFLIIGMIVGIVMVLMIVGELQQYENRVSSTSTTRARRATARRQEDARTATYEFEMV